MEDITTLNINKMFRGFSFHEKISKFEYCRHIKLQNLSLSTEQCAAFELHAIAAAALLKLSVLVLSGPSTTE